MYEVYYTIEYSTNIKCIKQSLEAMAGQHWHCPCSYHIFLYQNYYAILYIIFIIYYI